MEQPGSTRDIPHEWGPFAKDWPEFHIAVHLGRRLSETEREALTELIQSWYGVGFWGGYDFEIERGLSNLGDIDFRDDDPDDPRVEWYIDMGTSTAEDAPALGMLIRLLQNWSKNPGNVENEEARIRRLVFGAEVDDPDDLVSVDDDESPFGPT